MSGITAIVLAGGPADDLSATQPGAPNKAFVEIGGKTLAQRTIEGLRSSHEVGRIIAVAPMSAHGRPALVGANECRPDGTRITESLRSGLAGLPPDELVLVAASDLPILTELAVSDFVRRSQTADPDVGYGCLEKRAHLSAYPDIPHTWAPLRGGTYCGGGLLAIKPRALPELERFIEKLGVARKNPLALASIFGWDVLLKFAIRLLSIEEAEARASTLLRMKARAIVSPYAETAVNVDRVSDIALAEALVATRESSSV
ncbi:MAG: nucleotidyltransferase family protein [Candidatus Eremiobacteraeota bacterium]|nr:nucleotidyltransferase family protein [Candidatus Eremiobacteraeota bacterium]